MQDSNIYRDMQMTAGALLKTMSAKDKAIMLEMAKVWTNVRRCGAVGKDQSPAQLSCTKASFGMQSAG